MDKKERSKESWIKAVKGSKVKPTACYYIEISNAYSLLSELLADSGPPSNEKTIVPTAALSDTRSKFKQKAAQCRVTRTEIYLSNMNDNGILDIYINKVENERTFMTKNYLSNRRKVTIDEEHMAPNRKEPKLLQRGNNAGYTLITAVRRIVRKITKEEKRVRFARKPTVATFRNSEKAIMVTYDSGAYYNHMSE